MNENLKNVANDLQVLLNRLRAGENLSLIVAFDTPEGSQTIVYAPTKDAAYLATTITAAIQGIIMTDRERRFPGSKVN